MLCGILEIKTESGRPIPVGDGQITPVVQTLRVGMRRRPGGFEWLRPLAVIVKRPGQEDQTLPVVDVTRLAQWSALAGAIMVVAIIWFLGRQPSR
jgi:hypothetical protein